MTDEDKKLIAQARAKLKTIQTPIESRFLKIPTPIKMVVFEKKSRRWVFHSFEPIML